MASKDVLQQANSPDQIRKKWEQVRAMDEVSYLARGAAPSPHRVRSSAGQRSPRSLSRASTPRRGSSRPPSLRSLQEVPQFLHSTPLLVDDEPHTGGAALSVCSNTDMSQQQPCQSHEAGDGGAVGGSGIADDACADLDHSLDTATTADEDDEAAMVASAAAATTVASSSRQVEGRTMPPKIPHCVVPAAGSGLSRSLSPRTIVTKQLSTSVTGHGGTEDDSQEPLHAANNGFSLPLPLPESESKSESASESESAAKSEPLVGTVKEMTAETATESEGPSTRGTESPPLSSGCDKHDHRGSSRRHGAPPSEGRRYFDQPLSHTGLLIESQQAGLWKQSSPPQ
jgi:hypothetical protein